MPVSIKYFLYIIALCLSSYFCLTNKALAEEKYDVKLYVNEEAIKYSSPISRQLNKINPIFNEEIKEARLYSEISPHLNIEFKIEDGKLNFIIPSETTLQEDFLPDHKYKYVATARDNFTTCFKFLGWDGHNYTPVWASERERSSWHPYAGCAYHPIVFEGVTVTGKSFMLRYLFAADSAPNPNNYSTNPNNSAKIGLRPMANYAVVTEDHPAKLFIYGDLELVTDLKVSAATKGRASMNILNKISYDNSTGEYTIPASIFTTSSKPLKIAFQGKLKYNSNPVKPSLLNDTMGYEIYLFHGSCSSNGTTAPGVNVMLSCSYAGENERKIQITKQGTSDNDGAISFDAVPAGTLCTAKSWDLKGRVENVKLETACK